MKTDSRILILGAGLTGLSAAAELGDAAIVLEREDVPGGCLRTDHIGPYLIDRTGHLFHMRSQRVMEVVERIHSVDWNEHERDARVMVGGGLRSYPIQYNLFGLPPEAIADCVADQALAKSTPSAGLGFGEWARLNFGNGMWELFFRPYNRKLWQFDLEVMTAEWTGRFVPPPDIRRMVLGALAQKDVDAVGYNSTFAYPRSGGSQTIVDALATQVSDLRCGASVREVRWSTCEVVLDSGEVLPYRRLISTAPLDRFVDMLVPAVPEITTQREYLAHNSIGYVVFAGPAEPPRWHWTYVVDESLAPFRIGNLGSYGEGLAPDGDALICVERAFAGSGAVAATDAALIESAEHVLRRRELALDYECLHVVHVGRLDPAYVVFTPNRASAVRGIRHWAAEQGIAVTGRYGAWTYGAAGDAILQGIAAARWSRIDRG